jgi:hypothetical protein
VETNTNGVQQGIQILGVWKQVKREEAVNVSQGYLQVSCRHQESNPEPFASDWNTLTTHYPCLTALSSVVLVSDGFV